MKRRLLTCLFLYVQSLIGSIIAAKYRPIPTQYSGVLSELVKVMLRPDPSRRPSSEQLLGAKVLSQDVLNYMQYIKSLPVMTLSRIIAMTQKFKLLIISNKLKSPDARVLYNSPNLVVR